MATRVNDTTSAAASTARSFIANPAELPSGTLVELFLNAVDTHDRPDAQLYRDDDGWRRIPHAQVLADVRALCGAFEKFGIQRGDRVALLGENRPEWALVDYATLCSGVLSVPVYSTLPANQIAFVLRHSGARAIFVSTAEQAEKIRAVRGELPALEHVVSFDPVGDDIGTLAALLAESADALTDAEFRRRARLARPDDVATLIYTSGTTGEPKGVMLTHNNIHSNVQAIASVVTYGPGDVALSFLPLSHVLQRTVDHAMFAGGVSIAYVPALEAVAQALGEVRPTIVVAVPRVYEKFHAKLLSATGVRRQIVLWARQVALDWAEIRLGGGEPGPGLRLKHRLADRLVFAKLRARLGGRLRFFVSGAAPLGEQLAKFFYGAGVTILEGYGLTETSPVTNVNTPEAFRVGTVGLPVPATEIMIAPDGEILVRGPQVMKGYYDNPDATREAIDEDGWFRTGDIGSIDEDGFLRITGRKKELIVTAGGKNIAPQPLENAARLSRYVAEAVLIGDRRAFPVMIVVPNFAALEAWARGEGMTWQGRAELAADPRVCELFEAEVAHRLQEFARYELPKKLLVLEREFSLERDELTPTMKVKRRVVEATLAERIDALYDDTRSTDGAS